MQHKIAAFGFRSIPPQPGCAGADKFAEELFMRLAAQGFKVTGYNRIYGPIAPRFGCYKGLQLVNLKTVRKKGFDTLLHSFKATFHIILHNTGSSSISRTVVIASGPSLYGLLNLKAGSCDFALIGRVVA